MLVRHVAFLLGPVTGTCTRPPRRLRTQILRRTKHSRQTVWQTSTADLKPWPCCVTGDSDKADTSGYMESCESLPLLDERSLVSARHLQADRAALCLWRAICSALCASTVCLARTPAPLLNSERHSIPRTNLLPRCGESRVTCRQALWHTRRSNRHWVTSPSQVGENLGGTGKTVPRRSTRGDAKQQEHQENTVCTTNYIEVSALRKLLYTKAKVHYPAMQHFCSGMTQIEQRRLYCRRLNVNT